MSKRPSSPQATGSDVPKKSKTSEENGEEGSMNTNALEEAHQFDTSQVYAPPTNVTNGAAIKSMEQYRAMYQESIADPDTFWAKMAAELVSWQQKWTKVRHGGFQDQDVAWFLNGKLNACYNCVDRHVENGRGDKVALLWESDDAKTIRRITYNELLKEVGRCANALKRLGVRKGDPVCIYMPMVPEAVVAMLACARIGAPHSVVFAGFSSDSLRDRIIDGDCRVVLTADEGRRGGKLIPLKKVVDETLKECPDVRSVLVLKATGNAVNWTQGRDVWWHDAMERERPYCPAEVMDSEDPLFFLFTSGSTGKPKGILHTTGGYLTYAAATHKLVFDIKADDVYACVADVGWITGHSYIVYGPLVNGSTTFLFESTPLFPDAGRYWDMVQRHKISIFYTAPTAIRALMKFSTDFVKRFDRSSLRVLGSVGEPINPEAWKWYYEVVGDSRCAIVDTYWQTETGGHMITSLPGCTPMKPGSASFPFFGVQAELLDEKGQLVKGNDVKGVLCIAQPWPGMSRTCVGDHLRYINTYNKHYPGYYFTGDGAYRDKDGYYWVTGRVDDVMSVSGHRIGSAEIESALVGHPAVAEAAVVGIPHDIKGQSIFAYVTPKEGVQITPQLSQDLRMTVRTHVGAFAAPDEILITQALPKTRSGKIMRRILRKVAANECNDPSGACTLKALGDISTLADEAVVPRLLTEVAALRISKAAVQPSP